MQYICTERLILRKWQKSDLDPFTTINQDSRVFVPTIFLQPIKFLLSPSIQLLTIHFAKNQ